MDWELMRNFFIAMLAIINPLGKIPLWAQASNDQDRHVRWRLALLVTSTALVILLVFLLGGQFFLNLFGIDLASFRIGGGTIILMVGLDMLRGTAIQIQDEAQNKQEDVSKFRLAQSRFKQVAVPLAMPLMAGPGSISTVVVYSARADSMTAYLGLSAALGAVMLILFLILLSGNQVQRVTGATVLNIQTRVFGLLLAGIAVQLIAEGLGSIFPAWVTEDSSIYDELQQQR
jgi:multiple antibiotic resistance protein